MSFPPFPIIWRIYNQVPILQLMMRVHNLLYATYYSDYETFFTSSNNPGQ